MNDPLFGNKLAGAALAALLLLFGLPQLTNALIGGGHHGGGDELHLAYCCVDLETETSAGGEKEAKPDLGTLLANASVASGERRSALCASCHTFGEGGANGTGPNLWDIVGRAVASVDGFNYSSALKEAGGIWTYERLDAYLTNSQEYIPGTAMVQRIGRDDQRADILAYLGSLSNDPVPFPEPAAPEVEDVAEDAAGEGEAQADEMAEETASDVGEVIEQPLDVEIDTAEEILEAGE